MRGVAKVQILGRITRKPELRYTKDGTPMCGFGVAVNRKRGQQEFTDFFDVKSFRKQAEFLAQYTDKGTTLFIEGDLQSRKYTHKDGSERTAWEIQAGQVEVVIGMAKPLEEGKPAASFSGSLPAGAPIEDDIPF